MSITVIHSISVTTYSACIVLISFIGKYLLICICLICSLADAYYMLLFVLYVWKLYQCVYDKNHPRKHKFQWCVYTHNPISANKYTGIIILKFSFGHDMWETICQFEILHDIFLMSSACPAMRISLKIIWPQKEEICILGMVEMNSFNYPVSMSQFLSSHSWRIRWVLRSNRINTIHYHTQFLPSHKIEG